MKITAALFRAAHLSADLRSLRSPKTAARRAKNKIMGRTVLKPIWRLWRL